MRLRNGEHGYGLVTRLLHWATVAVLAAQVVVGYLLDDSGQGRGRGRGRGEGPGRGRGRGGDDGFDLDDVTLRVHLVLGLVLLTLAVLRLLWRAATPLPPWSERLSERDRHVQKWVERALLTLLVVTPLSGLTLLIGGDDDLLPLHVTFQVLLYVTVAAHVLFVLVKGTAPRMLRSRAPAPAATRSS